MVNGMASRYNGRKSPQKTPSSMPNVTPTLEIMENVANAEVHFDFLSVSIISKFIGVAAAEETNEKIAYKTSTLSMVLLNKNKKDVAAMAE